MKTILFQGDSITDAGRQSKFDSTGYAINGFGCGYPHLIAARLGADRPDDFQILNRAITGNRIVDLYARWKIDALNLKPDILSILIGVNDVWHEIAEHNGVEAPRFDEFYRRILDWSLQSNPALKLVILEPFTLPFAAVTPEFTAEVKIRQGIVQRIARDYHAIFIPLQGILSDATRKAPMEHWLVDGVHPQLYGHQLIADAWLKAAAAIL